MSKWGWAERIGGYAAAPFTAGLSIPIANAAANYTEKKQAANDQPPGVTGGKVGSTPATAPAGPPDINSILSTLQGTATQKQQVGSQAVSQGMGALGPVLQYLQQLTGSNPAGVMDATRADRGRVIDQYDAARRSIGNFGPRGGGTTGALAQSRFDQASSLADITSSARRDAVATEGELGTQLAGLGLNAEQLASADLNSIINEVLNQKYLDVQKRGQNASAWGAVGDAAGKIIAALITKGDS